MARGWESKAVESQQADREARAAAKAAAALPPLSVEDRARQTQRQALTVALARAHADLAKAHHPAHRQMLESAIATLTEQLR